MVIDQVLPDGHGVVPAAQRLDNQLAVRLTRTRAWRSAGAQRGRGGGGHRPRGGRVCGVRVGGHHRRNGRFCRVAARTTAAPHPKASGFQVAAGRLPAHPGGLFDAAERPAESPQRQNLLSFLVSQDVAHAAQERRVPRRRQRLGSLSEMAGFQVSINGRFWVSTERGAHLKLFRWEGQVVPRIGPAPQDVVVEQTLACDIYLGIRRTGSHCAPRTGTWSIWGRRFPRRRIRSAQRLRSERTDGNPCGDTRAVLVEDPNGLAFELIEAVD